MGIKIDEAFKNLLPPLSAEELAGLESGLVEAGRAINPIVTWPVLDRCPCCESVGLNWINADDSRAQFVADGGAFGEGYPGEYSGDCGHFECADCGEAEFDYDEVIIDGHNRYEICTRLDLPFKVVQMIFADRQAAENWIDRHQLDRRNLNPKTISLIRGRTFERDKKGNGERGPEKLPQNEGASATETAEKLATQFGVSRATIERDAQFARAVETVKTVDPTIEQRIHKGEVAVQSVVAAAEIIKDPEKIDHAPATVKRAAEVIPAAPKVALPTVKPEQVDPTKSDSITIDAWEKLTPEQRDTVLTREGATGFNSQDNESIEWALWSWNPITGCQHNCPYCYARDIAERFAGSAAFPDGFKPALRPGRLAAPQHQKFPEEKAKEWMGHKNVFTGSMADIFGKWVPAEWIEAVLASIRKSPQWNFLMLTKFPSRMSEFNLPDNVWAGTSVDCQARVANAEKAFAKVKAKVKWLSIEPMIEPLKFKKLEVFNWVVIGGASKSNETPAWSPPREWVDQLESQCQGLDIPYYEKSNLFTNTARRRGYPGQAVYWTDGIKAPEALQYLPPKEQFVG